MSALSHVKRNPHARASTLAYLIVQDQKTVEFYDEATLGAYLANALAKALSREPALRGDA